MRVCAVCGGEVEVIPDYGVVHVIGDSRVFPACNEGLQDVTGHVPVVVPLPQEGLE